MATRFYVQTSKIDGVITPAIDAGWEGVTFSRFVMRTAQQFRTQTLLATQNRAAHGVSGDDNILAQLQSFPLNAQTISGTVSGIFRVNEVAATDNFNASFVARVVSNDGTTVRGTLLASYGGGTEFPTATATVLFPAGSPAAISSVNALDGDRIIIEIGFKQTSTVVTNGSLVMGDSAATDYALTEGLTTLLNPWIEFSQDLDFQQWVAPESFYYTPLPVQMGGDPSGYVFFTLPPPDVVVATATEVERPIQVFGQAVNRSNTY